MEIDLVYLWVNGNDPMWVAKRDACVGKTSDKQENCEGRYADSGELKYSLRSVDKYAPWIRNIFIVTDNQTPEWLDTSNPRVHIVDHTEIMPQECLPCFNSAVIEQFLHKIPNLSEFFLYANDDTFFNQTVSPSTFFDKDGKPYMFLIRKRFRKMVFFLREKGFGKPLTLYLKTIRNASKIVEKRYGTYYGGKLHHNIDAYRKSTLEFASKAFEPELLPMRTHHMRSEEDIQRCLFSYVALAEKQGHLRYVSKRHSFQLHIANRRHYAKLEKYNPVLFCMNDSEYASLDDRLYASQYMEERFPEKSQFEK